MLRVKLNHPAEGDTDAESTTGLADSDSCLQPADRSSECAMHFRCSFALGTPRLVTCGLTPNFLGEALFVSRMQGLNADVNTGRHPIVFSDSPGENIVFLMPESDTDLFSRPCL